MIALSNNEIQVWVVSVDPPALDAPMSQCFLGTEETARARRLRSPLHARRFIAAHAAMRLVLSAYTGKVPGEIEYGYMPGGKPYLLMPPPELHFNLSHSGGLAAIAVAGTPVGIDVESINRKIPFQHIAERYFSAAENRAILSLVGDARLTLFYNCWTRKEAFMKALGSGFALPSDSFDVSSFSFGSLEALCYRSATGQQHPWVIKDLSLPDGFVGAIATEVAAPEIRMFSGSWGYPPLILHSPMTNY